MRGWAATYHKFPVRWDTRFHPGTCCDEWAAGEKGERPPLSLEGDSVSETHTHD